jgi:short-subunit dehydrogenase
MTDMTFAERYGAWALICGGSTGIGSAFASEAASRGLNLLLTARRTEVLEATADDLRSRFPVEVRTVAADMGQPDIRDVIGGFVSGLDVGLFIFNAAAEPQALFLETPEDELASNIAVNITTPTMLTLDLAKPMVERGRGGVVLISSMASLVGMKLFVAYGAAKAYEMILGEGLWDELGDHGVDAFTYVVGSTGTPSWYNNPRRRNADLPMFDEQQMIDQAPGAPRRPEDVGAELFRVLDRDGVEIGPRHYSHPDDEATALRQGAASRRDLVSQAGKGTSSIWY